MASQRTFILWWVNAQYCAVLGDEIEEKFGVGLGGVRIWERLGR